MAPPPGKAFPLASLFLRCFSLTTNLYSYLSFLLTAAAIIALRTQQFIKLRHRAANQHLTVAE